MLIFSRIHQNKQKMKKQLLGLSIMLTISCVLWGQNSDEFFKTIPLITEQTPDWAVQMYADNPKVSEVVDAYETYYKTHSFEKTLHTQNYKHWLRSVLPLVDENGFIKIPTENEENLKINHLKQQKAIASASKVAGAQNEWVAMGPFETYNQGSATELSINHKNVYAIDQSASNPNLLICGTEAGGVYKSIDKGENWTLISKNEPFAGNNAAVKIHPTNENVFLVASNKRIYRSLDGGATWTDEHFINGSGYEFRFKPDNHNIVFCVGRRGLWRSTDGGDTWAWSDFGNTWDIDFHPTNPNVVYLLRNNATTKVADFYRSDDGGLTWTLKDSSYYTPAVLSEANDAGGKIAVTPAAPNSVYVCLIGDSKSGDNGWIGVYKSTNQGEVWNNQSGQDGSPYGAVNSSAEWNVAAYGSGYHQGFFNFDLEVSDVDSNKLWVATIRLSESTDGGATFTSIGAANTQRLNTIHADVQDIEVNGSDIFIATDGGVNYSNDELQTAIVQHRGIQAAEFWGFDTGWNEDTYVGGKYHDGTTGWYEGYGLGTVHHIGGVEEPTGYVHPIENRKLMYRTHYVSSNMSVKTIPTTLGGSVVNHQDIPLFPNESYYVGEASSVFFDPRYANHIYIGRDNKIYKSTNGGISFDVLYAFPNTDARVYDVEISRDNPNTIYCIIKPTAGTWMDYEIWKSIDAGQSWTQTASPAGNKRRIHLTQNPADENEIWVGLQSGGNGEKVYQSTDGGATWINKTTATLNGEEIMDIYFQGGANNLVYVATWNNVFHWNTTTSDWTNYSSGLPFVVKPLKLNPFYRDAELRLGTGGRGAWARAMADTTFTPIAQPITYDDSTFCATDTVQFDCYSMLKHQGATWQWSITPTPSYISSASARNPKVVFGAGGNYDVALTVTDENGATHTKTISDMVKIDNRCDTDTIPGHSLDLNGAYNARVSTPALNLNTNTLTISAWVKRNGNYNNWNGIVFARGGTTTSGLNLGDNNELRYHWNGGKWSFNSGLVVPDNEWTHVALVVEPSKATIYMNGVPSVNNDSHIVEAFDAGFQIGADMANASRRFKGEIDEVCIWNRALDIDEIRKFRHLTKEDTINDPTFVAYYQFNEVNPNKTFDRSGNGNHGQVHSDATRKTSTAPVGGGVSQQLQINSGGVYDFAQTGMEMTFPITGVYPDGNVVVSRIHLAPDTIPNTADTLNYYWIVNNYGVNNTFDVMDTLKIKPLLGSPSISSVVNPSNTKLYKRTNENEDQNNWIQLCSADTVYGGSNGLYLFGATCSVNNMGQYYLSATTDTSQIIPVDLLSFTAQNIQNTEVQLDWESATEINLAQYEIEHSLDSLSFTQIGIEVPVSPVSDTARTYQHLHLTPTVGDNFYRLKMVSTDGSYEYSIVRKVIILESDLILFEATAQNNDSVQLHWQMGTEVNINQYEIEHSTDNVNFSQVGVLVPPLPNSTTLQNYYLMHFTPAVGTNYYRLKILNLDGSSEYSNVKMVEIHATELASFVAQTVLNQDVKVDWQMIKEVNVDRYELEYASDSINFALINTQTPTMPTNLSGASYTYEHLGLAVGKHFYRLKIIHLNGDVDSSNIVSAEIQDDVGITVNSIGSTPITIYPNPSENQKIEVHLGDSHSGRLYLYNTKGKLVKDVLLKEQESILDLRMLTKGIYYYSVITDLKIQNGKLLLGN